jgi:aspartyl-tRNA(Asn)/glutamyl-tRNA(Gln) amidotransferase subunit A
LRAGLRLADIPAPDADLERVLADGALTRMADFVRTMRNVEGDALPDYVAAWSGEEPRLDLPAAGRDAASRGARPVVGREAASGAGPPDTRRDGVPPSGLPDRIAEVAPLLRRGEISPVDLVERALSRITERDAQLNAFQLVLAERAREGARQAEAEIRTGAWRGPLHGVPVAVKDLFAMAGTVTTAGSRARGSRPDAADAAAVERLMRAGAIVIGKTRLPEFAFWPGSANPHYGPTANPHDASRDAGGSSSGSAAAVADGMALAALGSDTGGSIRIPAALCGVVGLKPTFGRVSLFGCTSLAWSLDHAGPLARTVEDAALLLAALAGHDPRDPRTRPGVEWNVPPELRGDGASAPDPARLRRGGGPDGAGPLRIGVLTADGSSSPLAETAALASWHRSCLSLERAGATLVEIDLPEMAVLRAANLLILGAEAATYHAAGLRSRYGDYGEPCRTRLLAGFAYSATDLAQAHRLRRAVRERWGALFGRIDALSTPSQPDVAPPLGEMASVKFTGPFNALGWPAVSVPFGTGPGGLPLATQLVGRRWDEATPLRVAQALEVAG